MSEEVKVKAEELINWLKENAGNWAGIAAADGVIAIFDYETGETMNTISVDKHLVNDSK